MAVNAIPVYGTPKGYGGILEYANEIAKTASYTVTQNDHGTLFTNTGASGAITFTLPALSPLLSYGFLVVANQNVTVASKEGSNIVADNNASASNVAYSTPGMLIGGHLRVWCNQAGTKWYCSFLAPNAVTIS